MLPRNASGRRIPPFVFLIISTFVLLAAGCKVNVDNPLPSGGSSSGTGGNGNSPTLASLAVTPANPSITQGTTQQFTATGTFSDNSKQDLTGSVTWTSSSTTVATISGSGLANGASSGSSTITVTSGLVNGSTKLTVTPRLNSIAVTPPNPTIVAGTAQQFTATGTFSDGSMQDLTSSVTWTSVTKTVATINNAGLATAVASGSSIIMAASGAVTGSTTLNVIAPTLSSITVIPANSFIIKNVTKQFTAIGTFTNGSIQDLTNSVTWSSSAPAVATISTTGLVSTVTAGQICTYSCGDTGIKATSGTVSGSTDLTVTAVPPTRFAYALNQFDLTITTYTVNLITGQLRASGYIQTPGSAPSNVVVDPSGKFAYVPDFTSNTVAAFTIDPKIGALTAVAGSPLATGTGPGAAVVDPSSKFLYVSNSRSNNVSAYTINSATGALTAVTGSPFAATTPGALVVDPTGKFLYVAESGTNSMNSGVFAFTINATTGALTPVAGSPFAADAGTGDLLVDPSGKFLYAANVFSNDISAYTINTTTGALTAITGSPFAAAPEPNALAIDPIDKFLYVTASYVSNTISVFSINTTTGALTSVTGSPFATSLALTGFTLDSIGNVAFATAGTELVAYGINTTTGAVTQLGEAMTGNGLGALALASATSSATYVPKFAYVTNANDNDVSAYTVSPGNGALASITGSPFSAHTTPASVTVDPSGKFAYAANANSDDVSAYSIDAASGALTAISGSPFSAGSLPVSVAVDSSARFAYVANSVSNSISGFTINSASGVLTTTGVPQTFGTTGPFSLAIVPTGRFVYAADPLVGTISAYRICFVVSIMPCLNLSPGALSPISGSPFSVSTSPGSIAVDPSGNFAYEADRGGRVWVLTINAASGSLAISSSAPAGTTPFAVTVDPTDRFVYVANRDSNNVSAFTINFSTGALTPVTGSPFAAGTGPFSVAVDPSGSFVYVANNGSNNVSVYTINSTTGALTPIPGSPFPAGMAPSSVVISGSIQ